MEILNVKRVEVESYSSLLKSYLDAAKGLIGMQTYIYALSRNKKAFEVKFEHNRTNYFEMYNKLVAKEKGAPKDFNPLKIREEFMNAYNKLREKHSEDVQAKKKDVRSIEDQYNDLEKEYLKDYPKEMALLKVLMSDFDNFLQQYTEVNIYKVLDVEKLPEDFKVENFEALDFMIGEERSNG